MTNPGDLPAGWTLTTVKELAVSKDGFFDGDWVESKDQDPNGDIRLLQLADIGDGKFLDKSDRWINQDAFQRLRCTALRPDDVLIARMPDPLGRACLMPEAEEQCITVVDVAALRVSHADLSASWVMHTINAPQIRSEMELKASGTTRKRISRGNLGDICVPLPPKAEQQRIADKLDTTLARVHAVNDRLARVAPLLKRFRQSVLAAATSGRLTADWRQSVRSQDYADSELQAVLASRATTERKPASQPDLTHWKTELPDTWAVASVHQFAECLDRLRVPIKKDDRQAAQGLYPYYGANGEVGRIDEFIFDDELVLVTEDETFYGREKPIAYRSSGKCWVNNHAHVLRAPYKEANDYLCYALMYYNVIPWLSGTTGRAKLTQAALNSLPIGVPPKVELLEIVRRVDLLFAFAERLEARLQAAQTAASRLTPALLAKAFRGELVPQDPNDEPASELLRRLTQSKPVSPAKGRKRQAA